MPRTEDGLFEAQFDAKIYLGMDDSAFTGQYRLEIATPDTDWVDVENKQTVTLIKKDNEIIGQTGNEQALKVSLKENGIVEIVQYRNLTNNALINSSPINVSAQIKDTDGGTLWISTSLLIDLNEVEADPVFNKAHTKP